MGLHSSEQIKMARRTNLVEFCERNGYELKPERNGDYKVTGHAGLIIKDNYFYRYSTGEKGSAIDFCMNILGMHFKDAVEALLDVNSVAEDSEGDRLRQSLAKQEKKVGFMLPTKAAANSVLFPYLVKVRQIPMKIVKSMIAKDLVYQDENYNCVFPCFDSMRNAKGAILRGTNEDLTFKGRAADSDMNYGWVFKPDGYCETVIIVEAPIDAMSLMALYPGRADKNYLLALGGLHLEAIKTFLRENRQVAKVVLALDNDEPAKEFTEKARLELKQIYKVDVFLPKGYKDWNEILTQKQTA
jgi:hypothetical protein